MFFFFNDTATTEIYTLSLHDALPILTISRGGLLVVILISGPEGPRVFESDPLPKDGTALDVDKSALFESQTQLRLSARVLTVVVGPLLVLVPKPGRSHGCPRIRDATLLDERCQRVHVRAVGVRSDPDLLGGPEALAMTVQTPAYDPGQDPG